MRIRLAVPLLVLLAAVLPLSACGDGGTGPSAADVTGMYTLQTANGASLPAVLFQMEENRIEVTSGRITLNQNRRFSESFTYRQTFEGITETVTETDQGTYTQNNSTVVLRYGTGEEYSVSVTGDLMTAEILGTVFQFRR